MDVYQSEEEQVAALKKWWKENGTFIIGGVVIGLGGVFGWQAWQNHQGVQAGQAAATYEQLLTSVDSGIQDSADKQAELLKTEYSGTPYDVMSGLALARLYVEKGDLVKAEAELQRALDAPQSLPSLTLLIRERLARVLLSQEKADEAKIVLDAATGTTFSATWEELRGDILKVAGQLDDAKAAYNKAILAGSDNRRLLQMKIADLGLPE